MPDWLVNLIVGLFGALLGFIGGFFTKTYQVKVNQRVKGNNNSQSTKVINHEENNKTRN